MLLGNRQSGLHCCLQIHKQGSALILMDFLTQKELKDQGLYRKGTCERETEKNKKSGYIVRHYQYSQMSSGFQIEKGQLPLKKKGGVRNREIPGQSKSKRNQYLYGSPPRLSPKQKHGAVALWVHHLQRQESGFGAMGAGQQTWAGPWVC